MNPWFAFALVGTLAIIGYDVYQAGREAQAKDQAKIIRDLTNDRDTAKGNAERLELALTDANSKVLEFEANLKADLKKKAALQALAKVEAGKGEVRVKAAQAVTTSTDDVLRAYWSSYGQ